MSSSIPSQPCQSLYDLPNRQDDDRHHGRQHQNTPYSHRQPPWPHDAEDWRVEEYFINYLQEILGFKIIKSDYSSSAIYIRYINIILCIWLYIIYVQALLVFTNII